MRVLMGILRWVMGLLAVLLVLSTFKDAKPVHALGFLVLSALLLPPAYRRVDAWFLQRLPVALRKPAIFMAIGVAIAAMAQQQPCDELQLKRLKRRKLLLKDQIAWWENT